jgi:hypothetical protein
LVNFAFISLFFGMNPPRQQKKMLHFFIIWYLH